MVSWTMIFSSCDLKEIVLYMAETYDANFVKTPVTYIALLFNCANLFQLQLF